MRTQQRVWLAQQRVWLAQQRVWLAQRVCTCMYVATYSAVSGRGMNTVWGSVEGGGGGGGGGKGGGE